MKKLLFLILLVSTSAIGQVLSNQPVVNQIAGQNPFLDASTNFGDSGSIGKGMVFPRTDLTTWTFDTSALDGINFPTAFDGMIVYNTGTGSTLENQGQIVSVTPGFYYFSNPGATDNITNGQWIKIAAGATDGKFVDGTDPADAVYTEGDVGIGISNPEASLDIRRTDGGNFIRVVSEDDRVYYPGIKLYRYATGFKGHVNIAGYLAQGTQDAPSSSFNSQSILSFSGLAFSAGSFRETARIALENSSFFGETNFSGAIRFVLAGPTGAQTTRMFIQGQNGFVGINQEPGIINAQLDLRAPNNLSTSRAFRITDINNLELFTVRNNGNIVIGSGLPAAKLDVNGYVKLGSADTTGDALPQPGMMRYNATTDKFQGYVNNAGSGAPGWVDLN